MRKVWLYTLAIVMLHGAIEARNIELLPHLKENPKGRVIKKKFNTFLEKALKKKKIILKNSVFSLRKLKTKMLKKELLKHKKLR